MSITIIQLMEQYSKKLRVAKEVSISSEENFSNLHVLWKHNVFGFEMLAKPSYKRV